MKWFVPVISVLFVLFLIVAIYLPGVIDSRTVNNWRLVCVEVKTIAKAQADYSQKQNGKFATFEQLNANGLLDSNFSQVQKHGYKFSLTIHADSFDIHAVPVDYKESSFISSGRGAYSFYSNQNGVVYGADKKGERATLEDAKISCNENTFGRY